MLLQNRKFQNVLHQVCILFERTLLFHDVGFLKLKIFTSSYRNIVFFYFKKIIPNSKSINFRKISIKTKMTKTLIRSCCIFCFLINQIWQQLWGKSGSNLPWLYFSDVNPEDPHQPADHKYTVQSTLQSVVSTAGLITFKTMLQLMWWTENKYCCVLPLKSWGVLSGVYTDFSNVYLHFVNLEL